MKSDDPTKGKVLKFKPRPKAKPPKKESDSLGLGRALILGATMGIFLYFIEHFDIVPSELISEGRKAKPKRAKPKRKPSSKKLTKGAKAK